MRTQVRSKSTPQIAGGIVDVPLLLATIFLVSFGWVMIASASFDYAYAKHGDASFYLFRHGIYLLLAGLVATICLMVPLRIWESSSPYLLAIAAAMLAIILLPGVGYTANGATRWLKFGGITFQVSEFAKLAVIVYMASYLVRQQQLVRENFAGFVNPMIVLAVFVVLLLMEPDFGAVVVVVGTALALLFVGGVKLWQFSLIVLASVAAAAYVISIEDYRLARLDAFLNPWEYRHGGAYQLVQSLIAMGRGDLFGVGLGESVQKQFYLPEAHTDFVFAIVVEELGALGALLLLTVYGFFIQRILHLSKQANSIGLSFHAFLCCGIAVLFFAQMFINIGVNVGLLPTKGLTLPFLSYGGSSLLLSFALVALVMRVNYEVATAVHASSRVGGRRSRGGAQSSSTKKSALRQSGSLAYV